MTQDDQVDQWGKMEARLRRRWPRLEMQDLADVALGQASLLECLVRHYDIPREQLAREITNFENSTPPPDIC